MTAADRLERDLADWFRETAAPALPHYTDDIVRHATHSRQTHRWTLLERWLPMTETALQPVRLSSPVPWRSVALLALLALAVVAGVTLVAGTRPSVPAPFGLANNGLVAYANAGDIFTVDPATGARRQVTTGNDEDSSPRWSLDGSRIAFLRGANPSQIVIVDADGGNPVTSGALLAEPDSDSLAWAPDGRSVAVAAGAISARRIHIIDAAAGTVATIDAGYNAYEFYWRPPDARQLLFSGVGRAGPGLLLYTLADGTVDQLPVDLAEGQNEIRPVGWTPDGARYAYQLETGMPGSFATQVVDLATGVSVDIPVAYGHLSNEGTRIAGLTRDPNGEPCVASIEGGPCVPIGTLGQAPVGTHRDGLQWSPDDGWIVTIPFPGSVGASLLDPEGADVEQPAWLADGAESWQRVP